MKCLILAILVFYPQLVSASYNEVIAGWGIEYRFGKDGGFDVFAFSEIKSDTISVRNKYKFSQLNSELNYSCVPPEGEDTAYCNGGWVKPVIYLVALPVSLYMYKKAFNIK